MEKQFLNFIIDKKTNDEDFTHLFNISSAISYFPSLRDNIIENFYDEESSNIKFYEDKIKNDSELRKYLICSLMEAEKNKYKEELLKNILAEYLTSNKYQEEIKNGALENFNKEDYKLASVLLYDYYVYLDTGIYNGLYTKLI